jgi:hypothetical protein
LKRASFDANDRKVAAADFSTSTFAFLSAIDRKSDELKEKENVT